MELKTLEKLGLGGLLFAGSSLLIGCANAKTVTPIPTANPKCQAYALEFSNRNGTVALEEFLKKHKLKEVKGEFDYKNGAKVSKDNGGVSVVPINQNGIRIATWEQDKNTGIVTVSNPDISVAGVFKDGEFFKTGVICSPSGKSTTTIFDDKNLAPFSVPARIITAPITSE